MLVFILFLPAGIQQFTIFQIPGIHFSYPQVCLADKDRLPGIPAEKRRSGGHAEKCILASTSCPCRRRIKWSIGWKASD